MKKSENLTPVYFDDKDIIVDNNFWSNLFDESNDVVSHCESYNAFESLFFLLGMGKAYRATIIAPIYNVINVTAIKDDGTMYYPDVNKIIDIFTFDNHCEDNDIYVEHTLQQEHDGRIVGITLTFNHTEA